MDTSRSSKTILALLLTAAALTACTRPDHAMHVLQAEGYRNITITGYRFFGCDSGKNSDDDWHTGFEATGPTGIHVTGVVCEGLFKNATVRID